jgi:hypothetical protein
VNLLSNSLSSQDINSEKSIIFESNNEKIFSLKKEEELNLSFS